MTPNNLLWPPHQPITAPPSTPHCSSTHPACLQNGLSCSECAPSRTSAPSVVWTSQQLLLLLSLFLCCFWLFFADWICERTWHHKAWENERDGGWGKRKEKNNRIGEWQDGEEEQRGEKKPKRLAIKEEKAEKKLQHRFRVFFVSVSWGLPWQLGSGVMSSAPMGAWHNRDCFGGGCSVFHSVSLYSIPSSSISHPNSFSIFGIIF